MIRFRRYPKWVGFTLVEILVVLVLTGTVVGGIYTYLAKQRKQAISQRLRADIESMAQISFFIVGRDIRRAGSRPRGAFDPAAFPGRAIDYAKPSRLVVLADLDGDGVDNGGDERVTYEWVNNAGVSHELSPNPPADRILRQAGNQLVIENVRNFDLCYQTSKGDQLLEGVWNCSPADAELAMIRRVRMKLVAGTGRINPNTGKEDTKDVQMNIYLRNLQN